MKDPNQKNWKVLVLKIAVALIGAALLFGAGTLMNSCSPASNNQNTQTGSDVSSGGFTITDLCGRQTTFDKPANTVVALTASDVEVLYAIGAGDTLIGRGTYCDYPSEALSVQDVGSGSTTSIESIVALKPDVVLMSKMNQTTAQVDALENAGIKVVVNEPSSFEDTFKYIEIIGKVTGHEDKANQTIEDMKTKLNNLSQKAAEKSQQSDVKHSVYFEVSPLQYGLWTAGSGTFMQEICQILNLTNCFEDLQGWSEVSQEQVIARNPNYIIAVTMYDGKGMRPEDEIMSRPGWDKIDAVQRKNVCNVDSNTITRPTPRLVDAAQAIYDAIYKD